MFIKDLLSIIVPVYNTEKYLNKCVTSILSQTYKKIELILVDDGSTDNSLNICYDFKEKDNRVKVFHKNNEGSGLARKYGINFATGEFMTFVDSDDFLDNDMYSRLIKNMGKNIEIIQCSFKTVKVSGELIKKNIFKEQVICGKIENALHYIKQFNINNSLCNKVFKSYLFENVIHSEYSYGEDYTLLCQLYSVSKKSLTVSDAFYNYVMLPSSLCHQKFSVKKLEHLNSCEFLYNFYKNYTEDLSRFSTLFIETVIVNRYHEVYFADIDNFNKNIYLDLIAEKFDSYFKYKNNKYFFEKRYFKNLLIVNIFKINKRIGAYTKQLYLQFSKYYKY